MARLRPGCARRPALGIMVDPSMADLRRSAAAGGPAAPATRKPGGGPDGNRPLRNCPLSEAAPRGYSPAVMSSLVETRETRPPPPDARSIVLVGLMGAGKSCIGRRLAQRLGLRFVDADSEIEAAAGCSIPEIFERHGEAAFRDGERKVIARLLDEPERRVLATGGGAFMDAGTRAAIAAAGVSVWLRADLELLLRRTGRRGNRPLLRNGNPREILSRLIGERYPVYAQADITVDSLDAPPEQTVERVAEALAEYGALT